MIVEKTTYGKSVKIWNDGYSDDWAYHIRNVKVLNSCFDKEDLHPLLDNLSKQEAKNEKRLLKRMQDMEDVFRKAYSSPYSKGNINAFEEWEVKHGKDFNEWFHDGIRNMVDEIDEISRTYVYYATRDGYPYCF